MADVELVIKIPEELLSKIDDENYQGVIWWYDATLYCAITNGTSLPKFLDKITAEISDEYNNCNICEWFEDYDYEENNISEYRSVGSISDIIEIIDKYKGDK